MKKRLILAAFLIHLIPILSAEQTPAPTGEQLVIGKITVDRRNVFETGSPLDKQFPYSWANAIHIVTTEGFIRQELLFREGSPYDEAVIRESERLLRSRGLFRVVTIRAGVPQNGKVDIDITTEDVWTTTIQLAYGTAGGKNFYKLGVLEHNFLGGGQSVGAFVRKDIDRYIRGVNYQDPRFLGTRWEFLAGYGRDQKGVEREVALDRPYFSALTGHSEGVAIHSIDDEDRLFENGDEAAKFQHETRDMRGFVSFSVDPAEARVHRVSFAHERQEDNFFDFQTTQGLLPPSDRIVSALLVGYEYKRVNFVKEHGVLAFDRDEDFNLGWKFRAEAGPSLEALGATRDGAVHRLSTSKAWKPSPGFLWLFCANSDGRIENGRLANTVLKIQNHTYALDWWKENTAFVRMNVEWGNNLDRENQVLLGGENGLRGYSVRQFSGNKKALVILENRQDLMHDWLHLINLGWAAFLDTGGAWHEHESPSLGNFKSDVGVGLRFAPSRSVDPTYIRADIAYALNDNDRKSRFVFNIGGEIVFGERHRKKFEQ